MEIFKFNDSRFFSQFRFLQKKKKITKFDIFNIFFCCAREEIVEENASEVIKYKLLNIN